MRLYKRTYGLRQICNIAVYIVHSACTIQLLSLPEKTAKRDIMHGVRQLEEIAEDWLCARRTLSILSVLARKWKIELPEEASLVLARTDIKYGTFSTSDVPSPKSEITSTPTLVPSTPQRQFQVETPPKAQAQYFVPQSSNTNVAPAMNSMDFAFTNSNGLTNIVNMPARMPNIVSPAPSPRAGGSMSLPPDSAMQLAQPYSQRHAYPMNSQNAQSHTSATSAPGATARQVSPSTMFGGVDALVESQDWWLRDQAMLAVDFNNWDGDLSHSASSPGSNNNAAMNNNGNGMMNMNDNFMFGNGGNIGGMGSLGEDDWYTG